LAYPTSTLRTLSEKVILAGPRPGRSQAERQRGKEPPQGGPRFALVLSDGRHIESSWKFAEADLLLVIRVAEA